MEKIKSGKKARDGQVRVPRGENVTALMKVGGNWLAARWIGGKVACRVLRRGAA
ncbi:hypothetical protein L3067_04235 [Xanthomonas sp. PPL568]|uniref:hypothetical protein n=1 Tax=Xanthomonas indica TaxID=2912242 RepID=UPI001F59AA04|nr:hypothetical protein [Xanthomonas indica]MCI2243816.1 hypothetical protein [Xanthomonas indica]